MKKLLTLACLLGTTAVSMAQVTFTYKSGQSGTNNASEQIDKLFDKNDDGSRVEGTKYCGSPGDNVYAIVEASKPVYVYGYEFTTANDNNGGRLLKRWTLSGTNDESVANDPNSSAWVVLSAPKKNNWVQGDNFHTQTFFCEKSIGKYKYYKIVLNEGDGLMQLSDVSFLYEENRVATFKWKAGPDNSKKAVDGVPDPKWEGNSGDLCGDQKAMTIETTDGNSYMVKKYFFMTNDDGSCSNRAPKSWRIEGSTDNSNWMPIANVADDAVIQNENFQTFAFTPSNTTDKFQYVRLTLDKMKGTGWSQVGDFYVLAISDVSDADYYTAQVEAAKASVYDRGSLSENDPWYKEYLAIYNVLDAVLAECKSTGDFTNIDIKLQQISNLVSLMNQLKASGTNYLAFDGTTSWGDGHWSQLVDGKDGREGREGTKWGAHFENNEAVQYVIFRVRSAFVPYFYKLVTGGDTHSQTGRNWKTWNVYGQNFNSMSDAVYDPSKWTLLDKRVDITEQYLPFESNYPASFNFNQFPNGLEEEYYYYMVEIIDSYNRSSGTQMNEMSLCTEEEFSSTRDPLVAEFSDFDTTRPVEEEYEDELASFISLFEELKTTADAVRLTELYNQCLALRSMIEGSMDYLEFLDTVDLVDGAYQLGTSNQLVSFAKVINSGRGPLNAVLTANIDMTGVAMAPIGTGSNPYSGVFDGKSFTIEGYTYDSSLQNQVGLFGVTNGATIQNVMLKGARVVGYNNAGGLVGDANKTTIKSCAVVDTYVEGRDHVAAIVANAVGESVISNNFSNAEVFSRQYQAGGMVGTVKSVVVEGNLFTGTVTCDNGGDASGLVSRIDADNVTPVPVFRNNMVAASAITGGNTYALINPVGREGSYLNNYTLKSTVYSTGDKVLNQKDDQNGMQVEKSEATVKSFYTNGLGWDMVNDWKFIVAGQYPVLSWMEGETPTQTVAVTEAGYATFVAAADLDIPADVEVYAVQVMGEYAHLEPIATSIPAGEAVVVKATPESYDFAYAVENVAEVADNDLKAATSDVTANGTQYVLASVEEITGFYRVEEGSVISAGKAYLEVSTGGAVKGFYGFDGEATGIKCIETVQGSADAAIYNLAGQRLNKVQKGINIVNGKKILF